MNIAVNKLKKTSESVPDPILYFKELSSSFKNLITRDVWKSIAIKIIDLVSHICVSKKVSKLFETLCEGNK